MVKHKAFLMLMACKKCLKKIIMHKNKGCGSQYRSFEKYEAYHMIQLNPINKVSWSSQWKSC